MEIKGFTTWCNLLLLLEFYYANIYFQNLNLILNLSILIKNIEFIKFKNKLYLMYSNRDKNKDPWLNAWKNPVSGIKAFSKCMQMCDTEDDGDFRLIIAN